MFNKKSQAAMEFLMTYGWAILVVLVAIGALAYFGVLSPEKFLPNRCTLPSGIACIDHRAVGGAASQVVVVLRNAMGYEIDNVVVSIGGCGVAADSQADGILLNGEKDTFTTTTPCSPALTSGSKLNEGFGISYRIKETGLYHVSNGTITTRVE